MNFEKRIYILPDTEARIALLKNQMKKTPNSLNDDDFEYLANATEGFFKNFILNKLVFNLWENVKEQQDSDRLKIMEKWNSNLALLLIQQMELWKNFKDLNGDVLKFPDVDIVNNIYNFDNNN